MIQDKSARCDADCREKGVNVSTTELERVLLETLAKLQGSGSGSTQAQVLSQARAWEVDEYSVRDALSRLVENKRIEMTLGIYAHALPSMQQDAARRLGALLHG